MRKHVIFALVVVMLAVAGCGGSGQVVDGDGMFQVDENPEEAEEEAVHPDAEEAVTPDAEETVASDAEEAATSENAGQEAQEPEGENRPAADETAATDGPKVIANMDDYKYEWGDFEGHKYADTTGAATLILAKNGDLYYFGAESAKPVVIMQDVKAFSLDDDSGTLGYTSPVAGILTNSGDLYVCGDYLYGSARDINTLSDFPDGLEIPFTKPVLVNSNVADLRIGFRQATCVTNDNKLYRSPDPYGDFTDRPENPTKIKPGEDVSEYLMESMNYNFVLENTVQMGCGRSFFISVLEDGSVWSCFLPDCEDDIDYAKGYGEVLGDGSETLLSNTPVCVFPAGTVF